MNKSKLKCDIYMEDIEAYS